jgi:hypothetical protein
MTEPEDSPESPPGDSGLFSQLPSTRPGTRSPRRDSTAAGKRPPAKSSKPAAMRAAAARPAQPKPRATSKTGDAPAREPGRPSATTDPGSGDAPSQLEELAWAGIAVTAEAATLGVRLIGRAFEAARKATDRADRE